MKLTGYLWTLGLGMVGGAAAAMILPKQPAVKQAVTQAADSITNAVETAKDAIVEQDDYRLKQEPASAGTFCFSDQSPMISCQRFQSWSVVIFTKKFCEPR